MSRPESPDFTRKTVEILGKRAGFRCSNPDCRKGTVGPTLEPNDSATIGEAAHIKGARPGAKRYDPEVSVGTIASITNGIWLCRNCHKLVDTDDSRYTCELLYLWREEHERYVLKEIASAGGKCDLKLRDAQLSPFEGYPSIIRRIVIDRPMGWEWRLTAELMRYLNEPIFRKLNDLRENRYFVGGEHVSEAMADEWIQERLAELKRLLEPLCNSINQLNSAWGAPGEPGSVDEILHLCLLAQQNLKQVLHVEEKMFSDHLPECYESVAGMLKGLVGKEVEKVRSIPGYLDEVLLLVDSMEEGGPDVAHHVSREINFETPDRWVKQFRKERKRARRSSRVAENGGCLVILCVVVVLTSVLLGLPFGFP